jgi:hypothetical protein
MGTGALNDNEELYKRLRDRETILHMYTYQTPKYSGCQLKQNSDENHFFN